MFGRRITLFHLLGFAVRIDLSWIFIALLVTWSLLTVFREEYIGLGALTYWIMALAGMIGLFFSIIFHELSHSLMARRHGMKMSGITLFIFGGVAEMTEEPPNARAEFWMAIVGPLFSFALGLVLYLTAQTNIAEAAGLPVLGVLRYLAFINVVLACFNLVPGFPLDGGRVLRAVLWGWKGNLRWATRIASRVGSIFGLGLIVLGVLSTIRGSFISGIWWFMIGMFLRNAAHTSYKQLILRRALQGEPVHRFMQQDPVTVLASTTLEQLVQDYVFRHMYKMFPVVDFGAQLRGCISTQMVKRVPRGEWPVRQVAELTEPVSNLNSVDPGSDALRALTHMNHLKIDHLLVVEEGRLVGVLALKDLLQFLALKVDLEDRESRS